jgi:hypothetical protein
MIRLATDWNLPSGGTELGIESCANSKYIRDWSIGHKNFPAVQNVVTAIFPDAGLHRRLVVQASIQNSSPVLVRVIRINSNPSGVATICPTLIKSMLSPSSHYIVFSF